MDATEMKGWEALCDNTEATETTAFDAVAIVAGNGIPRDVTIAMVERWSTHAGHRIRATAGGLWTWDFGPDGEGYDPGTVDTASGHTPPATRRGRLEVTARAGASVMTLEFRPHAPVRTFDSEAGNVRD
ncbi:hypothetical protein [Paraburkholderia tropica]|uniref:hypothetical protein n=1 Tax=Paraburkholderia tropica TaxID=92647 RepID=UPI002AB0DF1F|nr:hypothetical protein [Paraburkholderia tropica]